MAIKLGIVGCGYWGEKLVRNFVHANNCSLVYCCDLSENLLEKQKKSYPFITTTKSYADLLNSDIDAIAIATPVGTHHHFAKEALLKNKHVFVEKPLTNNVASAKELVELAQQNKKILQVDHTFEYSLPINKMKDIVQSGELGEIFYIRANWLNLGILQPDVNVIWDLCVHIFSIINYVLGEQPVSLSVKASGFIRSTIEEAATITLKFRDRKTASITVSWLEPRKVREFAIIGSKKMILYDMMNFTEQIKVYDGGVDQVNFDSNSSGFIYRSGDIFVPNLKSTEPLSESCAQFIKAILNNSPPRSDGVSGLRIVRMLEAADQSLRNNGEEVKINYE